MNQTPKECNNGVCKALKRSKPLSNSFLNTRLEISSVEMAHQQGRRAVKNTFGNESLLKHYRPVIAEECLNEDDDHAEIMYQRKDLTGLVMKRRFTEPLDSANATSRNCSVRTSDASFDATALPLPENHITRNSLFRRGSKKDMTAAKAFFPDFFPQQPVQDNCNCLQSQPTLEQIFSGQIKS